MATLINPGAASAVPFDASAWLAAWSDHGGVVMLAGDHLYVSRLHGIDRAAARTLDSLRVHVQRPGAGEALAGLLRRRSGEMT